MVRGQVEKVVCKGETQRSGTHEAKWVAAWQKPLGGGDHDMSVGKLISMDMGIYVWSHKFMDLGGLGY